MKKTTRVISSVLIILLLTLSITACFSDSDATWKDRWDLMVVKEYKRVNSVLIGYSGSITSSTFGLIKELEQDNIEPLMKLFREKQINFAQTEEISDLFTDLYYIDFINDVTENKDDENIIRDDTGLRYKYGVRVYIDMDGYVLVRTGENLNKWYRSNVTVDVNKIREYYDNSPLYKQMAN